MHALLAANCHTIGLQAQELLLGLHLNTYNIAHGANLLRLMQFSIEIRMRQGGVDVCVAPKDPAVALLESCKS